jgi:hypothetical protein
LSDSRSEWQRIIVETRFDYHVPLLVYIAPSGVLLDCGQVFIEESDVLESWRNDEFAVTVDEPAFAFKLDPG